MRILLLFMLHWLPFFAMGQQFLINGVVRDEQGQPLPYANIQILPDSMITAADLKGSFSISVTGGKKIIIVTFTGFETQSVNAWIKGDSSLQFSLREKTSELNTVTVTADRFSNQDLVQSTRSGTNTITQKEIYSIPVLMGEADLIKTLQLLPGTIRGVEGSSDLFVRGGAADQNLVLLDGSPIYNTSHLFGFLSVFNPDMLQSVEAMNGAFPAAYGGRLSSILDIQSRSSIPERTHISADVGLIASRVFIEQPIVKDKASIWLAGRRTYIDQVVKAVGQELPYFFYDLNGKIILQPSRRDKVEISHYNGEDILDIFRDRNNDGNGFLTSYTSGNSSQSLQWKHAFENKWESHVSLIRSWYQYRIRNAFEENELAAFSDIQDYGARFHVGKRLSWKDAEFKTGAEWIHHQISPNVINTQGTIAELLSSSASQGRAAQELSAFSQLEWSVDKRWKINAGLRGSVGIVSGKTYFNPEPRLSARYELGQDQALKFSYSRMAQYMHRISNSAVSTPTDIWYPVTEQVRPQTAHQFSAAWQRYLPKEKLYFSFESYYKAMNSLIGYEEGTNLFFNTDFESKLIQGKGRAYGAEVLIKKEAGRFTGWVSYTLSWSWRQYDEVNQGRWFHARYDRRHNGAVVMQYQLTKRLAASLVWEFISGARFTPVIGQYTVLAPTLTGFDLIPVYSGINEVKLADSHRLDLGLKFTSKPERKIRWQIFAGVYNAYNRASPIGIVIEQNETDGSLRYSQPGLFGLLPFISYGFKF